eukprot:gene8732-11798_t
MSNQLKAITSTNPFEEIQQALASGGDDRLVLNKVTLLNKYLSSTAPVEGLIRRGSCTCSTIDQSSFNIAIDLMNKLSKENDMNGAVESQNQLIIQRLSKVIDVDSQSRIVLFPSGSDAEYMPLFVALIRSFNRNNMNKNNIKVYNYVLASGEVGSGTPNAATGQHFSNVSPRGQDRNIKPNEYLKGIESNWIETIQYKPRNSVGDVSFEEDIIINNIRGCLNGNIGAVAILHVIIGTKTGLVYPSKQTIDLLTQEFNDQIIIAIDACQLRCQLSYVKQYVDQGFITLITSSKFFTGPPFSGGVILPFRFAEEIESHLKICEGNEIIPAGITEYLTSYDIPPTMPHLKEFISKDSWVNYGLTLRWTCGLSVMEEYSKLPSFLVESFTVWWVKHIKQVIQKNAPFLQVIETSEGIGEEMIGNINSIISIAISVPNNANSNEWKQLNMDECKEFHRLMTIALPQSGVAAYQVMLGQPVKLSDSGFSIVRIALGADIVVNVLKNLIESNNIAKLNVNHKYDFHELYDIKHLTEFSQSFQNIVHEDIMVIQKMKYLAANWNDIQSKMIENLGNINKYSQSLLNKFINLDQQFLFDKKDNFSKNDLSLTPATASIHDVSVVLKKIFPNKNGDNIPKSSILYDLNAVISSFNSLKSSFLKPLTKSESTNNAQFLHCFAIKSCPLAYILHLAVEAGLGLEAASINEVKHAMDCGCDPVNIMFDSPCKTMEEIQFALESGVHINANSYEELNKIKKCLFDLSVQNIPSKSRIGLRINPMVGAGKISALSTATSSSKFGIPMYQTASMDQSNILNDDIYRKKIIETYLENPFLTGIMCHVGSQGMSLSTMTEGAKRILLLADEIDSICDMNRITHIDIGGGLSANYDSDIISPSFDDYVDDLFKSCPNLFINTNRTIITEFGKSLITKCGVIVSVIEDVLEQPQQVNNMKQYVAIGHAGADVLLRTAYCPDKFSHRIALLNSSSDVIYPIITNNSESVEQTYKVDIVGPLCFSGDVISTGLLTSRPPKSGDVCLILDAGANSISLFSKHCSRNSPPVYGYKLMKKNNLNERYVSSLEDKKLSDEEEVLFFGLIRNQETVQSVTGFWH